MIIRTSALQANTLVYDQADLFGPDGFTRVEGLVPADLTSQLFYNNALQAWDLILGVGILDSQVVSGSVLWHEILGSPGFYSIRLRPNAVGSWRLVLNYGAGAQVLVLNYDVFAQAPLLESGLRSSFMRGS